MCYNMCQSSRWRSRTLAKRVMWLGLLPGPWLLCGDVKGSFDMCGWEDDRKLLEAKGVKRVPLDKEI